MFKSLLIFLCLSAATVLYGQDPSTIFHDTYDLADVNKLVLELHPDDSLRIEPWVGDVLLLETNVQLVNGRPNLMKHFLKERRWSLDTLLSGDQLSLRPHTETRNIISTERGTILELVEVVLYLPDTFEANGSRSWARKEE